MKRKSLVDIEVDGKVRAWQAETAGEAVMLNSESKVPGDLLPNIALAFTIPQSAWSIVTAGTNRYTCTIQVTGAEQIATPIITADAPDDAIRLVLADSQITALSVDSTGRITFVADSGAPTADIPALITGLKGTQTGKVVSSFGTSSSIDFYLNIAVSGSSGTPDLSGMTVTLVSNFGKVETGQTDSSGKVSFIVHQGYYYTVTISKDGYRITPPVSTVTIENTVTDITATCYVIPTLTVTCTGPDKSGRTVTAAAPNGTVTGQTDASGTLKLELGLDTYTVTCDYPAGQGITPASQSVIAEAGGTYSINFRIQSAPLLTITVLDMSSAGNEIGRNVTAVPETGTAVTGITGSDGKVTLRLAAGQVYTVICDIPEHYILPAYYCLTAAADGIYVHTFRIYEDAVLTVTATPTAVAAGLTVTATASGQTSVTGTTSADGTVKIHLATGTWSVSCAVPSSAYIEQSSQSISVEVGRSYSMSFNFPAKPTIAVTVEPTAVTEGSLVSAVGTATFTGYTNALGIAVLTVDPGDYNVSAVAPNGYIAPAAQPITVAADNTYTMTVTMKTYPVLSITVTPTAVAGNLLVTAVGSSSYSAYTDSTGAASITVSAEGSYVISCAAPSGYLTPNTQTITATAGTTTAIAFALIAYPVISITVTDSSSGGYQSGRTITAVSSSRSYTTATASDGTASITIQEAGTYYLYINTPTGATDVWSDSVIDVSASGGTTYTVTCKLVFSFKYTVNFNATTFKTNSGTCLTYADDAAGFTPMHVYSKTQVNEGSWAFSSNALLSRCKYVTLAADGTIDQELNPYDLTQTIDGGVSKITTENTMFLIPTTYFDGTASGFSFSDQSTVGSANAHTIGGHVYDWLGIGVYDGHVSGNKLMSLSGVIPTTNTLFTDYRTYAENNGTNFMLWNYYQWQLYKLMVIMVTKEFDSQYAVGRGAGGITGNTEITGQCNAAGPFSQADFMSSSYSDGCHVKALIEDPWGYLSQALDDTLLAGASNTYYVGQNAVPTDTSSGKTSFSTGASSSMTGLTFPNTILTSTIGWGIGTNASGSSSTGLCDVQDLYNSDASGTYYRMRVGGQPAYIYAGYGGLSFLGDAELTTSTWVSTGTGMFGARIAYVFDE